jgi:hypothetical protein
MPDRRLSPEARSIHSLILYPCIGHELSALRMRRSKEEHRRSDSASAIVIFPLCGKGSYEELPSGRNGRVMRWLVSSVSMNERGLMRTNADARFWHLECFWT